MLLKDEVELLRQVPMFAGIDPSKLKLLAFTSERMTFEPGQVLFEQGDTGDSAYLVLKGKAEILVKRKSSSIKVAEVPANGIIGEIAILCDVPRTATVRAMEKLDTLRIAKDHFLRMLAEYPDMAIQIMRVLADRLSKTTAELSDARAKSA
ncbi:MAG: cyclic nucleotide-binding domain-containing protein [Hyphomicrobiales bacterium]